jgi:hypothetical protein
VELQGMPHLLINDVKLLKVLRGEAFAEQHRRLLIELADATRHDSSTLTA